jgi:hypothetical protein
MCVCVCVCMYMYTHIDRQTGVYMLVLEHARGLDQLIADVKVLGHKVKSRRA